MKDRDRRFIIYWENALRKGRVHYAILHGFIFGTILFVLSFFLSHFDESIASLFIGDQFFLTLIIYLIATILYEGLLSWNFKNKRYKSLQNKL